MPRADVAERATSAPSTGVRFDAIGVPWRIDADAPLPAAALDAVHERIAVFDRSWSRFRDDSLVARIAREAGDYELPDEGPGLLALYRRLYELTGGRVSPFVGGALAALGYGGPASGGGSAAGPRADVPEWDGVARVDGHVVSTTAPVVLDVGAAGKGLLVDLVTSVLGEHGIHDVTVDASGDLRVSGARRERVALEHPFDGSKAIGVVEIADGALCASATNRRVWGDGLHHVIDGLTGVPVETVVATWAIAPTAAVADGAATALFFSSPAEVRSATGAIGVRMFSDGRAERHRDFPGELFS